MAARYVPTQTGSHAEESHTCQFRTFLNLTAFAAAGNGDAVHNVPIPRQVKRVKQVDRGAAMAGD